MSLINQALRKAQQDRSPRSAAMDTATPASDHSPAAPLPPQRSGPGTGLVVFLIVAIALLIGLAAGLSIVLLRGDGTESTALTASTPAETTAPTGPQATAPLAPLTPLAPLAATTPAAETSPKVSTAQAPLLPSPQGSRLADATPTLSTEAEAQLETLRLAREASEAKIRSEAEAAAQAPSAVDWLTRSRITGVRVSPSGSRVIMNGTTYTEGEYVNFELGLKVLIVEETRVLFGDENGKKYQKRFKAF